jgi:hypothetical protein
VSESPLQKAAEHRRTPKRGRNLHVQFALAFWSAVLLLHRFQSLSTTPETPAHCKKNTFA